MLQRLLCHRIVRLHFRLQLLWIILVAADRLVLLDARPEDTKLRMTHVHLRLRRGDYVRQHEHSLDVRPEGAFVWIRVILTEFLTPTIIARWRYHVPGVLINYFIYLFSLVLWQVGTIRVDRVSLEVLMAAWDGCATGRVGSLKLYVCIIQEAHTYLADFLVAKAHLVYVGAATIARNVWWKVRSNRYLCVVSEVI